MRYLLLLLTAPLAAQLVPLQPSDPFLELLYPLTPLLPLLTLEEFGTVKNTNRVLQPEARFNEFQPIRTNDYQPLQQRVAQDRQPIRMGPFYISQGPEGPGITIAASQLNRQAGITTPSNNLQIIAGATESQDFRILTSNPSTQTLLVNYSLITNNPPTFTDQTQTLTDYNVVGNAYHDVEYNLLTPQITLNNSTVERLFVDEEEIPLTRVRLVTAVGTKFKIELANGQTWLLYFEQTTTPVSLTLNLTRTQFTANNTFTGFLRFAPIQVALPPTSLFVDLETPDPMPFDPYATAIVAQTRPITPISMYLFWPVEWVDRVGPQIRRKLRQVETTPSCDILANILPILARTDLPTALFYFGQLREAEIGNDTNLFLTLFMILSASKLSTEIATYQSTSRPPSPYSITPVAASVEATYDTYRAVIPTLAIVGFRENRYLWRYFTAGAEFSPLILFPTYKTLETATPIADFGFVDPIKGPLLGVEATSNEIAFAEGAVPTFWSDGRFFPQELQFTNNEIGKLKRYYAEVTNEQVTSTDLINSARELYKLALTVRCATLVYQQGGLRGGSIAGPTRALMERVKATVRQWLVERTAADYFIGDMTTGGICSVAGMGGLNSESAAPDEGNALYNNHHLQYGYFLGTVAAIIEWDETVATRSPFINEQITTQLGTIVPMKQYVDMLWRDCRNFMQTDPQFPFNRHGNPWEGHSTANGILYELDDTGRQQERFGEDFHCWMSTQDYARLAFTTRALLSPQQVSMDLLATFAQTNMQLTATSGELIFQDDSWLYPAPFSVNLTVGQVFDTQVVATTTFEPGTPCVIRPAR